MADVVLNGQTYSNVEEVLLPNGEGAYVVFSEGEGGDMRMEDYDADGAVKEAGGIAEYVKANGGGNSQGAHASTHAADGSDPVTPESIGALSTEGGTVTQTLQFDRAAGAQGRSAIYKYNTSTADYGMRIKDEAANGNAFTFHLQAKDNTATLIYKPSDGEENKYKIYHEGNKPTAADVGAMPIAGGTANGTIEVHRTDEKEIGFKAKNGHRHISFIISASNNAGIYDQTNGKWLFGNYPNGTLFSANHTPPTSNGFRQSKLVSSDTDPTSNGDINWTYG